MRKAIILLQVITSMWAILYFTACTSPTASKEFDYAGLTNSLQTQAPPENIKAFEEVIKEAKDDPGAIQLLGMYAYLNRQLELAAWSFSKAAEKKPDDPVNLSNLGLALQEMYQANKGKKDPQLFEKSVDLLQKAVAAAPDKAAAQNNLGYTLYRRWLDTKSEDDLKKAEEHLRKAVALEPENLIALSHLAEVLASANKNDEAVALLNRVHKRNSLNLVFAKTIAKLDNIYKPAKPDRSYCDSIFFDCEKCRTGIIGGLEYTTCRIKEQSAVLSCQEGKPYATFFKCGDMGDSPWLIPGLHSGFTIFTPFGKLSVILHGDGTVSYKLEIQNVLKMPEGAKIGVQGTYDPSTGQSDVRWNASYSINMFNRPGATDLLNQQDVGPGSTKLEYDFKTGQMKLVVEVYGVPMIEN